MKKVQEKIKSKTDIEKIRALVAHFSEGANETLIKVLGDEGILLMELVTSYTYWLKKSAMQANKDGLLGFPADNKNLSSRTRLEESTVIRVIGDLENRNLITTWKGVSKKTGNPIRICHLRINNSAQFIQLITKHFDIGLLKVNAINSEIQDLSNALIGINADIIAQEVIRENVYEDVLLNSLDELNNMLIAKKVVKKTKVAVKKAPKKIIRAQESA